jgi:glycosyltransferase involved in cell wall biosynthesis
VFKGGTAGARNDGIHHATGSWVAFLDADDSYEDHRLDVIADFVDSNRFDGVMTDAALVRDGITVSVLRPRPEPSGLVRVRTPIVFASLVVRRQTLIDVGPFESRWPLHEDADMWLRLVRRGAAVGYVPRPMYEYRVRATSKTQSAEPRAGLRELRQINIRHALRPGLRYDERLSLLAAAARYVRQSMAEGHGRRRIEVKGVPELDS